MVDSMKEENDDPSKVALAGLLAASGIVSRFRSIYVHFRSNLCLISVVANKENELQDFR